jgi:DNA-binding MarR family transcriptional regulator
MPGKQFLETFSETKRVVGLVLTRAMAPHGVGWAQVTLLRKLGQSGPATQSALAQATMIDPSAAARTFTALSKRGWIRRRRGDRDRRESYVELTPSGRRFAARVEATYKRTARLLGARLNRRDVANLERICTKLEPLATTSTPEAGRRKRPPR